jgi:hypothetical protein
VTCTGTTSADIVVSDGFVVRFRGSAGPIDVMRSGVVGYTGGGSCPGRPTVGIDSRPDGHGRLMITVGTTNAPGLSGNAIYALGFNSPTPSSNAVIDIGPLVGATGSFVASLAPAQQNVTFYARPAQAGLPVTVGITAVDACGNWPTLAGGGPQTLQLSTAPPSADVVAATANPAVVMGTTSSGAPAVAELASAAPSAPVVNAAAPVSAPVVSAPPAISVPPAISAPPALTAPLPSAPAPSVGAPPVTPGFGGQPLVFPPFVQPQPLLPFAPLGGYPLVAPPPAPFMAPGAVGAPAPYPPVLPSSAAPAEAPPAGLPPSASPDSLYVPAPGPADSIVVPPSAAPPAEVVIPAAADAVESADSAAVDGADSVQPPFAQ